MLAVTSARAHSQQEERGELVSRAKTNPISKKDGSESQEVNPSAQLQQDGQQEMEEEAEMSSSPPQHELEPAAVELKRHKGCTVSEIIEQLRKAGLTEKPGPSGEATN